MNYSDTQNYLYSLKYHGAKYGIDRIKVFDEALGKPDRKYPIIHVAGTNGKGSTCAMLESIYRKAGYKTGLYTSPHLVFLGERIQVNRQPLQPESITRYVERLRPIAEGAPSGESPSFFEFMTGMAFEHFAQENVDIGIIEVGLGGRLDATNVVMPELSIITSISLDHQQQLGDTIEQIAAEKAGIIKPGVPVIIGKLPAAAEAVIRDIAITQGSPVISVLEAYGDDLSDYPTSNLEGDFQRVNAATATLAIKALERQFPIKPYTVTEALKDVEWAGRWQKIALSDGRTLILDTTHNIEGARMLEKNLAHLVKEYGKKPVVLAGSLGTNRAEALMPVVCRYAKELILFQPNQPRACTLEELRAYIPETYKEPVFFGEVPELFPTPGLCTGGEKGDILLATGSIYLIGEILEQIFPASIPGESALQDLI